MDFQVFPSFFFQVNWLLFCMMSETPSQGMERCKSKRVIKAIVYGNIASPLPKKREEDSHTHQWTVFVKPYHNEDPSKFIRKVQFKLHESYANSVRSLF